MSFWQKTLSRVLALQLPQWVEAVPVSQVPINSHQRFFDIQAHRGGRGNTIENTVPAFAQALLDGSTTLELDNGVTRDGVVVVWHDENIVGTKCRDTQPVTPDDPDFPYVGKYIANLTFAQLSTLDCGSLRQTNYPLQITHPGTRISSLQETFDFVSCVDPQHQILWNIEAKVNPMHPNTTVPIEYFVKQQHSIMSSTPYSRSITFQSFNWEALQIMKRLDPAMLISALIEEDTTVLVDGIHPWLGGVELASFNAPTLGERVSQAAASIRADILSPSVDRYAESPSGRFTTKAMVDEARRHNLKVKPWTVNNLSIVEELVEWGVDGIISDYPDSLRRWSQQHHIPVRPRYPRDRVAACLEEHAASWRMS